MTKLLRGDDTIDGERLYHEDKMLRRLASSGLPIVLLDEDTTVPGIHTVRDDSFEGARKAIQYLAELGHRRIAYAHWARAEMNPSRPLGYRKGMRDAGLYRRRQWEIVTELTEAGARRMVDRLLALRPLPTALYCFNNTLASMAIDELRRRDVRVPEGLSVLGAGGEEIASLTCHQADWHQMGRSAMQLLFRTLAEPGPSAQQHLRLPHALRVGLTTAAPPSRAAK
jgi:LacI family transcriptional regulator